MGRKLIIAEPMCGIQGKNIAVATAHFESNKENDKFRKTQMIESFKLLSGI